MHRHLAVTGAILATTLAVAAPAAARPQGSGTEELARLLAGRVAGPPQSCITTSPNDDIQIIDRTAYVFGRGNVIYVNRTHDPNAIDSDNVLVIRRFGIGTQLCRSDIITTVDSGSKMYTGNVFLGDFIPYRKVK